MGFKGVNISRICFPDGYKPADTPQLRTTSFVPHEPNFQIPQPSTSF